MYYEGLREGLRAATKVELMTMIDSFTDELLVWVERYGKAIWTMRTARIALMEKEAQEAVYMMLRDEGNKIVDEILDEVDWDLFFDHEDEFSRRLLNEMQIQNRRALMKELESLGVPVNNPDAGTKDDSPQPHPYTVIRKEKP